MHAIACTAIRLAVFGHHHPANDTRALTRNLLGLSHKARSPDHAPPTRECEMT